MTTGSWKSFADLEDSVSLPELNTLVSELREREFREAERLARMFGGSVSKSSQSDFDRVADRVREKLGNESGDLADMGLGFMEV